MTAWHMMSIRPMTHVPTKFHWDSFKRRVKSDPLLTTTTTTTPISSRADCWSNTGIPSPSSFSFFIWYYMDRRQSYMDRRIHLGLGNLKWGAWSLLKTNIKTYIISIECNYMLDLDLTSQGHSSPKPMAPFERASMTSYSTLMVTMDLSTSVSKLQPSEICLTSILPLKVTLG